LKYQKSTTPACKDYNLWRIFSSVCVFFYVTYKVSKKVELALVFKPQCLGLKISNIVRQVLNFILKQTTRNKII